MLIFIPLWKGQEVNTRHFQTHEKNHQSINFPVFLHPVAAVLNAYKKEFFSVAVSQVKMIY